MKSQSSGNTRIWTLFGVMLVILACSAVVGTRPAHASTACTDAECLSAERHANIVCIQTTGQRYVSFQCPISGETDDFLFVCDDGVNQHFYYEDCSTFAPS